MSGSAAAMLRVEVDRKRCCGAGHCALMAPGVFDQDPQDGRVILLDPQPPRALEALVRESARVCPTRAIAVQA